MSPPRKCVSESTLVPVMPTFWYIVHSIFAHWFVCEDDLNYTLRSINLLFYVNPKQLVLRLNNHEQNNETITKNAKLVDPRLCSNQKIPSYSEVDKSETTNGSTSQGKSWKGRKWRLWIWTSDKDKKLQRCKCTVQSKMSASQEQTIYWYRSLWAELFFTRRGGKVPPSLSVRVFSDKVAFALRYIDGSGQSPAIFAMRAGACGTQCCHLCQTCVLTSHSPLVIISRTFIPEEFPGKIYISVRLIFAFGSLCGEFALAKWVVRKVLHKYFWYHDLTGDWTRGFSNRRSSVRRTEVIR